MQASGGTPVEVDPSDVVSDTVVEVGSVGVFVSVSVLATVVDDGELSVPPRGLSGHADETTKRHTKEALRICVNAIFSTSVNGEQILRVAKQHFDLGAAPHQKIC